MKFAWARKPPAAGRSVAQGVLLHGNSWRCHWLGRGKADSGGTDAKKLDMRVIIRITAVSLVVFSLGWSGCQSTHSDGSPGTTGPTLAIADSSPEQNSTSVSVSTDPNPNTVPQTVQHTQPGMQNMPATVPAPRPASQTGKTLVLTGPPRVPARVTNQPASASPLVVTQAQGESQKGRIVIGPISFQGPPRHKAYAVNAQQKFWAGIMGGVVLAGVGVLVLMRKLPLWREKLRGMMQSSGGKNNDGPKLVLEGAPQKASPLGDD